MLNLDKRTQSRIASSNVNKFEIFLKIKRLCADEKLLLKINKSNKYNFDNA